MRFLLRPGVKCSEQNADNHPLGSTDRIGLFVGSDKSLAAEFKPHIPTNFPDSLSSTVSVNRDRSRSSDGDWERFGNVDENGKIILLYVKAKI
jgi:hypothetical protein